MNADSNCKHLIMLYEIKDCFPHIIYYQVERNNGLSKFLCI